MLLLDGTDGNWCLAEGEAIRGGGAFALYAIRKATLVLCYKERKLGILTPSDK